MTRTGTALYDLEGTIIQLGDDPAQAGSTITGVTEVSKTVRGGKLVVEYRLTGTDLKEDQTEIKVKQGMYEAEEWLYEVAVSGSGTEQTVTFHLHRICSRPPIRSSSRQQGHRKRPEDHDSYCPKEGDLVEEPEGQTLTGVTASKTEISNADRTVEFILEGSGLTENTGVKVVNQWYSEISIEDKKVEGTGKTQKITLTFPENEFDAIYTVSFYANGDTGDIFTPDNKKDVTITHTAAEGEPEKDPEITGVEPASQDSDKCKSPGEICAGRDRSDG